MELENITVFKNKINKFSVFKMKTLY